MDPLGLLSAVLAVTVFPGGLYLLAASGALVVGTGLRQRAGRWTVAEIAALSSSGVGAALLPFPGSPVGTLPPGEGAAPNLIGLLLLVATAAGLQGIGQREQWRWWRGLAAAAAVVPALTLSAVVATTSASALLTVPGLDGGRFAAGIAVLAGAPVALDLHGTGPRLGRAATLAVPLLLGALLILPVRFLDALPGVVIGTAGIGLAAMAIAVTRGARQLGALAGLAVLAAIAAVASVTMVMISPR